MAKKSPTEKQVKSLFRPVVQGVGKGPGIVKRLIGGAIESISSGDVRFFHPPEVEAYRERPGPDWVGAYPVQHHAHAEMTFCAENQNVEIWAEGRWNPHADLATWVYLPGAAHTERVGGGGRGYDMLWIMLHPETVALHVTAYRKGRGYFVHGSRYAVQTSVHESLLATSAIAPDRQQLLRFRALLVESLFQCLKAIRAPEKVKRSFQQEAVDVVRRYIADHFSEDLQATRLAALVHYTPGHLNALFRKRYGTSIHQYLLDCRLREAERLLNGSAESVKQIAYEVGFNDPLYFSRLYRKRFGVSPSAARA